MGYNFVNRVSYQDLVTVNLLALGAQLSPDDVLRLQRYRRYWNFFEGYHWEEISDTDKPEVTQNYCRAFVNKFVAFELGKGFSVKMRPHVEEKVLPFLNDVWEDNDKVKLCNEFGQMKSVSGDAWIQVLYEPKLLDVVNGIQIPNPDFYDPYDEYEKGRIRLFSVPSNIAFPEYEDGYDKDKLKRMTIMYPVPKSTTDRNSSQYELYKQVWDTKEVKIYKGKELTNTVPNKYGVIPFFHAKNLPLAGRNYGLSDLEDLIPMNTELNLKKSDISEIIDYHSAPVTVVFGARVGQLEKGANKVWGGLPKDAKVENLELKGDLSASVGYTTDIKQAMHEIGGVPEGALGKEMNISNTSGVALQVTMMPLIERINVKKAFTAETLVEVNKFIIKIGLVEGLITKPENTTNKDFYYNEIVFEDNLPKDRLVEIQQIQLEMKQGICDREEAMKRLGKTDIQRRIAEIDADMRKYPFLYGLEIDPTNGELVPAGSSKNNLMNRPSGENKAGNQSQVNSGLTNSPVKQSNTNS